MKKLFLMFILLCTAVIGALAQETEQKTSPATLSGGWTKEWSDEFDGPTLDADVWNVEHVTNPSNNELQRYNNEGVSVSGGYLVLTAKREKNETDPQSFTSGRVNSQGKYAFKYGKIEARVKIPKTYKGLWPAFWMMGDEISTEYWPACGELDIFEMGHQDGFIPQEKSERFLNGCLHYGTSLSDHKQSSNPSETLSFSVQDKYVIFGCEWNFNQIRCYVREDGEDTEETTYFTQANTGDAANYFNKPFHILFNLAVGGDFPGISNAKDVTALPNDDSTASMYVDYVAVYQKASVAPVGGNYFNASTTTMDSEFATSAWIKDNTSTASWDSETGTADIKISSNKNSQWQGKVLLKTSDIELDPSKQYKFSCKINSINAVNNVTVKLFDDSELSYINNYSLSAGENTYESTFNGGSVGNGVIVFDFGFAQSGDQFTISDIKIEEVTFPSSAAPVPTQSGKVKSLYSDSYTFAPSSLSSYNESWGGKTTQLAQESIGDNNYLHYSDFNFIGWDFANTDFSDMEYLHIDVCPRTSGTLNVYPISIKDGDTTDGIKYTLTGLTAGQWKSFDIPLSEFVGLDFSTIQQFKYDGSGITEFCVDNVYFYKPVVYSLIGGYNGKGWTMETDAIDFVYNEAQGNYTVTIPSINGEFKIAKNRQWEGILSYTTEHISAGNSYEFYQEPTQGENAQFEGTLENVKLTLTPIANSVNVTLKVELIPDVEPVVIDQITNVTAWAHVTPKNSHGTGPFTVTISHDRMKSDGDNKDADPKTEIGTFTVEGVNAGQTVDIPMLYLVPATAGQDLTVTITDAASTETKLHESYATITHQNTTDRPESARGELMNNANPLALYSYNPGFGAYRMLENYNYDDATKTYSYDMPIASNDRWAAQFRKQISYNGNGTKMVTLYDKFMYDVNIEFEITGPTVASLPIDVKIESTAAGNRGWDGHTYFLGEDIHNQLIKNAEGKYIYSWNAQNMKLQDGRQKEEDQGSIPGAVLVIDLGRNTPANTHVEIKNLSVVEKELTNLPSAINNEYFIYTADELQAFAQGVNSGNVALGAKAYLMADIDMADLNSGTYPGIGDADHKFAGEFVSLKDKYDKNSKVEHTVNLGTSATTGVFNYVSGATIEGVNVEGTINATTNNVGALVNNSTGNTTIVNCDNAASVSSSGDNVGGLVGKVWNNNDTTPNTLTIRNVVNRGNITANEKVGGIIGRVDDSNITLINVLNEATITAESTSTGSANAAGLVGCQAGDNTDNKIGGDKKTTVIVINSGNAGNINGLNESAAFFGYMASRNTDTKFTNCYNSGTITGQDGNNNLVRIHEASPLNPTRYDVKDKIKIMDNVYDASAPAGTSTTEGMLKEQGWIGKDEAHGFAPWTQTDVLDGALLNTLNGTSVHTSVLPWVQTVAADPHPVFVASAAVPIIANVQDTTNTTAVIHINPIAIDGLPITLKYEWLKPDAPTKNGEGVENAKVKETHYHTIIAKAGEDIYTPVMNLENSENQIVHVMVGNKEVADPISFKTLDHQKEDDLPKGDDNARGQLVNGLIPLVDFEPNWSYKDVEKYKADTEKQKYTYTMPDKTTKRWMAQFRKPLGVDNTTHKVYSMSSEYDYDIQFKVNTTNPANLIVKLESSATGWRNKDGETSIITNDHGTLTVEEIGEGGYVYKIENLKGQYLPGAILVVDLSQADANTDVTIDSISVIEKKRTSAPTNIDPNKNNSKLDGKLNSVTNNSVTLDMKGYDNGDSDFVAGKEVIYTITTNVGTEQTPIIKSWTTTGIGGQLSTYVVSGLDKNTPYTFNIKAQLEDGSVVGPSVGKDVPATTLNYDYVYKGMLFADNHKNDDYGKENGTENRNSYTTDKYTGAWSEIPNAAEKTGVTEIPYVIGYTVTVNPDNSITISGGIDADVAKITDIAAPTIWLDTDGDSQKDNEVQTADGNAGAFSQTYPAEGGQKPFDPETTRIDFRFPFTAGGFINSGYVLAKETRGALTLNAGVAQTTKTTATIYMNGKNGTSETVTYTIYRGEFSTPDEAEAAGIEYLVDTTTGSAGHNTNYTFTGLDPDTLYTYTVVVTDGDNQKKSQVVKPRTIPENLDHVEFDNTVDGTAENVWLNGTNTSYCQKVPYTYSFNLNYNENGTLTMIGGVGPQGDNTNSVSDAVGLVLPHVFIKKATESTWTDVQAPAGKPTEFYCTITAPEPYAKGGVVEVKVKYEYNGLNGENSFTTPTMRFVVDNPESGVVKTYHYFNENDTTLAEYMGTSKRVRIVRAIKAGHWNTFCVPFNVTKAKLIESMISNYKNITLSVHHLDGLTVADAENTYTMKFTENEGDGVTLEAGKPYLVKIAVADVGFTPSNVDLPAADAAITSFDLVDNAHPIQLNTFVPAPAVSRDVNDNTKTVSFQASYTALLNPNYVPRRAYIINRSQIRYVDSNVQMLGFRGYFFTDKGIKSTSSSDGSDVNKAKVSLFYVFMDDIDDGIITGINIGRDTIDPSQPVFNVSGQRVSGAVKGILIQNGSKFVNK